MESNVKFPVYGSYIFELLFKNKLFNYISRTHYYIIQSIESYSICYEQVFIRLQQSNLHTLIWLIFDELYTKIGYICDISISNCCSVSRVCFSSQLYQQFHRHTWSNVHFLFFDFQFVAGGLLLGYSKHASFCRRFWSEGCLDFQIVA